MTTMNPTTLTIILAGFLAASFGPAPAQEVSSPLDLKFRRQAVRRMVFDRSQDIPLSGLWPATVVGLDVMHPPLGKQVNDPRVSIEGNRLRISSQKPSTATRWVGGFNPFAVYDLAASKFNGSGEVGMIFRDTDAENRIKVTLVVADGEYRSIRYVVIKDGKEIDRQDFALPEALINKDPIRLRAQMVAVGVNLFVERNGVSTLIGRTDFVQHFDLRRKDLMRRFEFCLHTELEAGQSTLIDEAKAALSPGIGQADIRNVTYEDGSPYFKDGRLWMLMTVRGGALPHPMQGVFSINPSVFDIRFEGIILFDCDDGLLRNELGSNLIFDRNDQSWKGFTCGFSSYGDPEKKEKKQIWAVTGARFPLQGLSIMKAKSCGLVANYEDPQCIYDAKAKKWRMLLSEYHQGYKAVIRESDQWDGPYERISGPVKADSTGTQIQKIGSNYYVLFGSSDRKVYIHSYPDLKPVGELNIHRPPWNNKTGGRVWPNVIALPDGYPAPYIALMMDRVNFPGMTGPNWTYGAMYLYHGHPTQSDQ